MTVVETQARPAAKQTSASHAKSSTPPAKLRIAVVGCGAASRELHMPILTGHPGVEVAALIDRDAGRAKDLARAYDVGAVLTDTTRLTRDFVDAAIICTPPAYHAPGAIELLRRGIHVMVEKPMAIRYEDAEAMVRAANEAGAKLVVTVFRRLLPATRLLRGLLDAEILGRPLGFDVEEGEIYNWPTATLGNMCRDTAGGGVLIDFGSHTFDRLLFLLDGPGEVLDYRDNARGGIESDCVVSLRLGHKGRPIEGRVELSRTRNLRNSFRVRCERGVLELPAGERYKVSVRPEGLEVADPQTGDPREYSIDAGWAGQDEMPWFEAFRSQLDDWLAAIRGDRPPTLTGASVLPSLKLISDCYARPAQHLGEPGIDDGPMPMAGVHPGIGPRRRVLITGATGFIGGRLAEVLSLRDGWQVRALVHNPGRASRLARLPVEMVVGELNATADLTTLTQGCDAVVHCAIGTMWGDRRAVFDVTVGGTRQLAFAARASGVARFVHLSTFAVHDLSVRGITLDESTSPNPPPGSDYAESKAEAELVVKQAARDGLCAVTLRLANVYGPHSTIFTSRPLSYLMKDRLVLVGPAEDVPSSTVYVDNVVEAIIRALGAPPEAIRGQLFTISEGDDLTWADFYGYFADSLGAKLRVVSDEAVASRNAKKKSGVLGWAMTPLRGAKEVLTSTELWALTKKVLKTEPIYTLGNGTLEWLPFLRPPVNRLLGIDTPVVYERPGAIMASNEDFEFELTRPAVSNAAARRVLGFVPPVPRDLAMRLTLEWARFARIAGSR